MCVCKGEGERSIDERSEAGGQRMKKVKDLVGDGLEMRRKKKCETFVIGNRIEPSL